MSNRPQFENDVPGRKLGSFDDTDPPPAALEPDTSSTEDATTERPLPFPPAARPGAAALVEPELTDLVQQSPPEQLSELETAAVAKTLYAPTVQRMITLTKYIISMTQNGDFAFWAPLATMDDALRGLEWVDTSDPLAGEKLLTLVTLTMREYSNRLNKHLVDRMKARRAGQAVPPLPSWTEEDTVEMYRQVADFYKDTTA